MRAPSAYQLGYGRPSAKLFISQFFKGNVFFNKLFYCAKLKPTRYGAIVTNNGHDSFFSMTKSQNIHRRKGVWVVLCRRYNPRLWNRLQRTLSACVFVSLDYATWRERRVFFPSRAKWRGLAVLWSSSLQLTGIKRMNDLTLWGLQRRLVVVYYTVLSIGQSVRRM